jgi:hypothetical protein
MSPSLSVVLLSALFLISVRAAGQSNHDQTDSHVDRRAAGSQCGFQGDTDLYGLGIRLGYYFQGFSAWLANYFALEESRQLRPTNALFMLAMFVALVFVSHEPSEVHAIEAFVVMQLLIVVFYVASTTKSKWSQKHFEFDPVRYTLNTLGFLGFLIYNLWFWWAGLAMFEKSSCDTYVFWFAKVDLYGWYGSMYAVLAIIGLAWYCLTTLPFKLVLFMDYLRQEDSPVYFRRLATALKGTNDGYREKNVSHILSKSNRTSTWPAPKAQKDAYNDLTTNFATCELTTSDSHGSSPASSTINETLVRPVTTLPSLAELEAANEFVDSTLKDHPYQKKEFHILNSTARFHLIPLSKLLSGYSPKVLRPALTKYRPLVVPTMIHICSIEQHPRFLQSYFLHQAVAILETSQPNFSEQALRTVLALRVAALPDHSRRSDYLWNMLFGLFILSGLVVSTELALYWNHVSDTTDIGSVGQLVPLVIGAGGLLKVGWKCFRDRREGYDAEMEPSPLLREVNRCSAIFFEIVGNRQPAKHDV